MIPGPLMHTSVQGPPLARWEDQGSVPLAHWELLGPLVYRHSTSTNDAHSVSSFRSEVNEVQVVATAVYSYVHVPEARAKIGKYMRVLSKLKIKPCYLNMVDT